MRSFGLKTNVLLIPVLVVVVYFPIERLKKINSLYTAIYIVLEKRPSKQKPNAVVFSGRKR